MVSVISACCSMLAVLFAEFVGKVIIRKGKSNANTMKNGAQETLPVTTAGKNTLTVVTNASVSLPAVVDGQVLLAPKINKNDPEGAYKPIQPTNSHNADRNETQEENIDWMLIY